MSFERVGDATEFDAAIEANKFKVRYGIIDNTLYISFDISWISLQFKISSTSITKFFARTIYGSSRGDWVQIQSQP